MQAAWDPLFCFINGLDANAAPYRRRWKAPSVMADLDLDDTLGCVFVGVLFALMFYGCSSAQTLLYFRQYAKDPVYLKILVATLWFLDSVRIIADSVLIWCLTVERRGNIPSAPLIPISFVMEYALGTLTVLVVQGYYIYLIWRLLVHRWCQRPLAIFALGLAVVSFGGGVNTIVRMSKNRIYAIAIPSILDSAIMQTVTALGSDLYITITLCFIMYGNRTGFKRTELLLTTLAICSIRRGVFTALWKSGNLATYAATRNKTSLYWTVTHLPSASAYVISLLALLNSRKHLREQVNATISTNFTIPDLPELISFDLDLDSHRPRIRSRATSRDR